MAQHKKFGTFGGVFTPATLTILGVIMYLRLPWIVGQVGLVSTVGIILIAHIISISTGLSVASIATDKRVKTGGIYYMLSRSLGLPIGGTLGLALFVGISFSASLYVIGFAESFLGFLAYPPSPENIRVAGTLTLLLVSAITFAGAGLAIKTQYLIMAGIALSLVSIFLGTGAVPEQALLYPREGGGTDLMLYFGIFFPAVTGFTAGVQMSGDLKNPNRSLPIGTMLAIIVGLVVYIGLAVFFAFRIEAAELAGNSEVLLDFALYAPLVLAGIWGATLSSALGSLLGAPRILQATSEDRITPRLFARGFGAYGEPRYALGLSFLIAEAGILIGDLDIIARIVSMFFITTYGFLNFSAAIESWASPDFHPSFRVPKVVSIIGAGACIVVMILLDVLAMFAATLVLGGLYLYLARRRLTLESGDTWEGVWNSVARTALQRLNERETHERNWRPNIILFSGGGDARPHLLAFGKWLVYQRGVLSNFDLVEKSGGTISIPKAEQARKNEDGEFMGVFTRRAETDDIYSTMELIARFYGFSGVEPNTVLMGWARNSKDPDKLVQLLKTLKGLDFNVLLLDYDRQRGFGKRQRVDIWWRGAGNNISLALALVRYLGNSHEWRQARIRFLVVNDADSTLAGTIRNNLLLTLHDYRVDADVKVINNAVEQNAFHEIIKTESVGADLTITGIPHIPPGAAAEYVHSVNGITDELGTVLLIRASTFFKDLYVGIDRSVDAGTAALNTPVAELPAIPLPAQEVPANEIARLSSKLEAIATQFFDSYLLRAYTVNARLLDEVADLIERSFGHLERSLGKTDRPRIRKAIQRTQSDFLYHSQRILSEFRDKQLPRQQDAEAGGIHWLRSKVQSLAASTRETITVLYPRSAFRREREDSLRLRRYKFGRRLRAALSGKDVAHTIQFRALVEHHCNRHVSDVLVALYKQFGLDGFQAVSNIQRTLGLLQDSLGVIEKHLDNDTELSTVLQTERKRVGESFNGILAIHSNRVRDARLGLMSAMRETSIGIALDSANLHISHRADSLYKARKDAGAYEALLGRLADRWLVNQRRFLNVAVMNVTLLALQNRVRTIIARSRSAVLQDIRSRYADKLQTLIDSLSAYRTAVAENKEAELQTNTDIRQAFAVGATIDNLLQEIRTATLDVPESVDTVSAEVLNNIEERQFDDNPVEHIALRRLVDYHLESEFIGPLQQKMEELPDAFAKIAAAVNDALRLVAFHAHEAENDEVLRDNLVAVVESAIERLEREHGRIREHERTLAAFIDERIEKTFEQLNPYAIARTAGSLGQYTRRTAESSKVRSGFQRYREALRNFISTTFVGLLYRWSVGVLAARKLRDMRSQQHTRVDEILMLVEHVQPRMDVQTSLPFYYRHLFLGKPLITREFWVGRKTELQQAGRAIARYQRGMGGSVLITGEANTGKTTLAHFVARGFDKNKVFSIDAPESGSIDPGVFHAHLQQSLSIYGDFNEIFSRMPVGAALIINDLNLWWERSSNGFAVVDLIISLIAAHSAKCFFILNVDLHSFRFMNKIKRIDDAFLTLLECSPVDARALKEIILLRHRSTGLKFTCEGIDEDKLSDWKLARLFNRYFEYSGGKIGVALQAWISSIRKADKNEIVISPPETPHTDVLEELTPVQTMLALQCILHKRLDRTRLLRVCGMREEQLRKELTTLKTAGVLQESAKGALEIDPFLLPFIVNKFIEKGVL